MSNAPNEEQAKLWNGSSGQAWVAEQALLDHSFRRIEERLTAEVIASGARTVLDIGCGAGATTLAVARSLGARGHATGIDISAPLIAAAQTRARQCDLAARFIVADAQTYRFEAGGFDLLMSRFGVMFFDDPVAAFANLRRATAPGGQLRFVAFRSMADNPFMTTAERAAAPWLTRLPPRKPDAPGQFALADGERVRKLLEDAGWIQVRLEPLDVPCEFPAAELQRYFTRFGPVGQALREADESTRERVIAEVREAFEPYVSDATVRFTAACWMISAQHG